MWATSYIYISISGWPTSRPPPDVRANRYTLVQFCHWNSVTVMWVPQRHLETKKMKPVCLSWPSPTHFLKPFKLSYHAPWLSSQVFYCLNDSHLAHRLQQTWNDQQIINLDDKQGKELLRASSEQHHFKTEPRSNQAREVLLFSWRAELAPYLWVRKVRMSSDKTIACVTFTKLFSMFD